MNYFSAVGFVAWVGLVGIVAPSPLDVRWAEALLLLATFVLVPLAVCDLPLPFRGILFLAACALVQSFRLEPSLSAGLWSMPWLCATAFISLVGLKRAVFDHRALPELTKDLAFVFLSVGGVWTAAARFGICPLDFQPIIVFLTGIHFHFAGFALPLIAGGLAAQQHSLIARCACVGTVAGVPLVAGGITATQLELGHGLEMLAGLFMAASAILVALCCLKQSRDIHGSRIIHVLTGVCLIAGAALASLYALRFVVPLGWLDIPFMRATHGSLNAVACTLGLIAVNRRP